MSESLRLSVRRASLPDPASPIARITVQVPSSVDCIAEAVSVVTRHCLAGAIAGPQVRFRLQVALSEALANAIRYGCRHDPSREVQCAVACDQSRGMLIVVRDPGPGFDPASIPSPIAGQNVFSHHGRGIYLINQLMDEVSFAHGGTEIRMRAR